MTRLQEAFVKAFSEGKRGLLPRPRGLCHQNMKIERMGEYRTLYIYISCRRFGIGVVAVSGDHRSDFGLRFGLGIVWRPFCATNGASGFR